MTPLHCAAHSGKLECVMTLLDFGADIDTVDKYGNTALHKSVSNGHLECTKLLIERGVKINAHNSGFVKKLFVCLT